MEMLISFSSRTSHLPTLPKVPKAGSMTMVFKFWQKLFGYANRLLQQLSGWLVSDDLGGEDAGCGGPGLMSVQVVCGCEAGWMYCQIL